MQIRSLLLVSLSLLVGAGLFAQDLPERPSPDENNIPASRMEQHDKWLKGEYKFPAKERNMWQVALTTGALYLGSDINSEWGYGFGLEVRKALGYTVSARLRYTGGDAYGLNWTPDAWIAYNPAVNGVNNPATDYYDDINGRGYVYLNHKTRIHQLGLDALININNIRFHKESNFFAPYIFGGFGIMAYEVTADQLDANGNKYDYESVPVGVPRQQRDYVRSMLDRDYETPAQSGGHFTVMDKAANMTLSMGVGLGFKLSKRIEVGLEHRATWTGDDLVDGQKWTHQRTVDGPQNFPTQGGSDWVHYTSFRVGFNIGKNAQEPSWYVNPLNYLYNYLGYLDEKTDFTDSDDDGVPDLWDDEPDSPEGAIVDTHGVTKDSDGDGCPDHEDPEPFSSPQYPIVDCKTQWPEGISEERVVELIKENSIDGWFLPTIHFNTDKSRILPEFYSNMQYVGEMMNRYKWMHIDVIGHCDYRASEEYNLGLSQRRAEAAVNFLVENYGVSRDRFNIKYEGESMELVPEGRTEKEMYQNRRVEFKVQ